MPEFELVSPRTRSRKPKKTGNVLHSSESIDYYTPVRYVEAARTVMGRIDLDPASCEEANRVVKADTIFTLDDDGLLQEWSGRVWLNPPYGTSANGKSNQGLWSERLLLAYRHGKVDQAVLLVNATTDRNWFQPLWAFDLCFTDHRIHFDTPAETADVHQPTHGNLFAYLGPNHELFAKIFRRFGVVVPAGAAVLAGEKRP